MSISRNLSVLADAVNTAGTLGAPGGGLGTNVTPTSGGVLYGTGTTSGYTSAGISGQYLQSTGSGAPVWSTVNALPTQTGNSGKYLTTDGTSPSWAFVIALPTQTGQSGKYLTTDGTTASWVTISPFNGGTISSALNITDSTASTTTTTGALKVAGGLGVVGAVNIGSSITATSATINGAISITGTAGITGITSITNATASSTTSNGALVVTGGVGVGGSVNIGGTLSGSISAKVYQDKTTAITASTATTTIDLSTGNTFIVTISSNTTFSFTNPPSGTDMTSFTLITVNDATAGRAISWPASVTWAGGVTPTRTTTANKSDVYTFFTRTAGTQYVGSLAILNF